MRKHPLRRLLLTSLLLSWSGLAFGFGSIGNQVNANCPSQPYTGDCSLCHVADRSVDTPAKVAARNGDWAFFCPTGPVCTDADGDLYFAEGGDCGPQDCNDSDPAVNPAAAERCSDGIDNNCDGLTDGQDTAACPAPPAPTCTDADQDGFYAQAGCNTVVDCNDTDGTIFPGAAEVCGDSIDNDCDGMTDEGCNTGGSDGASLYEANCAACHSALNGSGVCGESAREVMAAIAENEGGMGYLSSLTDVQIQAIADALANCGQTPDAGQQRPGKDKDHKEKRTHDRSRERESRQQDRD